MNNQNPYLTRGTSEYNILTNFLVQNRDFVAEVLPRKNMTLDETIPYLRLLKPDFDLHVLFLATYSNSELNPYNGMLSVRLGIPSMDFKTNHSADVENRNLESSRIIVPVSTRIHTKNSYNLLTAEGDLHFSNGSKPEFDGEKFLDCASSFELELEHVTNLRRVNDFINSSSSKRIIKNGDFSSTDYLKTYRIIR